MITSRKGTFFLRRLHSHTLDLCSFIDEYEFFMN